MHGPRSNCLFHITDELRKLKSILVNGFYPYYKLEDIGWLKIQERQWVIPSVCFCDIPLTRIGEHLSNYGQYGLGMSEQWALKKGLNPVAYVQTGSPFAEQLYKVISQSASSSNGPEKGETYEPYVYLLAYTKPVMETAITPGQTKPRLFYRECEWRYVPPRETMLLSEMDEETFKDESARRGLNEDAVKCPLKFTPADVKYVLTAEDSEVPDLVKFINQDLNKLYPAEDLARMTTRILALDRLASDFKRHHFDQSCTTTRRNGGKFLRKITGQPQTGHRAFARHLFLQLAHVFHHSLHPIELLESVTQPTGAATTSHPPIRETRRSFVT